MFASLAGTKSASSDPFHFIKKNNSPGSFVAPMILSAVKPLANPLGLFSSFSFFFFSFGSFFPPASDFLLSPVFDAYKNHKVLNSAKSVKHGMDDNEMNTTGDGNTGK